MNENPFSNVTNEPEAFPPTSRYHGLATAKFQTKDGRSVVYVGRRIIPPADRLALLQEHTVSQGDRLDNLANQYMGDPEQFWQICDANPVIRPEELTEMIGRKLRITLPEGVLGV